MCVVSYSLMWTILIANELLSCGMLSPARAVSIGTTNNSSRACAIPAKMPQARSALLLCYPIIQLVLAGIPGFQDGFVLYNTMSQDIWYEVLSIGMRD